jgi:hypothetical protein
VYTPAVIFPMLPETLSTNLTSLNEDQDRIAVVADMVFDADAKLVESELYRAQVRNRAKLAYNSVAAWLDGTGPAPQRVQSTPGLDENLRVQDRVAQKLAEARHRHGALSLETIEARTIFEKDAVTGLEVDRKNRAKQLIEDFMIAANGVTAAFLAAKNLPSLRRVLRSPERWEKIMRVAEQYGAHLPGEPDAAALETFLCQRRKAAPEKFPDLSLTIVKLVGRGEYAGSRRKASSSSARRSIISKTSACRGAWARTRTCSSGSRRKAFGGHIPYPLLHIDTTYEFPEMLAYRDWAVKHHGLNLIVKINEDARAGRGDYAARGAIGYDTTDPVTVTHELKTVGACSR